MPCRSAQRLRGAAMLRQGYQRLEQILATAETEN
jgi:hypothetical protein